MKPFFVVLFVVCPFIAFAQPGGKSSSDGTCFKEWYALFKERGANPVADGVHDVIISLRNGDYSQCFMGQIEVTDGKLSGKLMIQKLDGSYEQFDKKINDAYQNSEGVLKDELRNIDNGMSSMVSLTDGESIRLFFYKALKERPKGNKIAPPASTLVKN